MKRELSKYSKEVLIKVFIDNCLFDFERLLHDIKWESTNFRMDTLRAKDKDIRQEMTTLIGKEDIKSFKKYMELMEQSSKIDKKINSVMREQNKLLGIGSGS